MGELDRYELYIGKFWVNFNSLELLLRIYLCRSNSESEIGLEAVVGEDCPVSHLTNYDSFIVLVKKFNEKVDDVEKIEFQELNRFRDLMAHGRVVTKDRLPVTVIKYDRPQNGSKTVKVSDRQVFTFDYLEQRVTEANEMVLKISKLLEAGRD